MPLAIPACRFPAAAAWTAAVTLAACGQAADPANGRAGGLVPGSEGRRAGLTREELVREWDLDGDGTISKSEADVARGRMRKRRIEMQLQTGIDPLAGAPLEADVRGDEWTAHAGAEPELRLPAELPPPPRPEAGEDSPPGMRPPAAPQAPAPARGRFTPPTAGEPTAPRGRPAEPGRPAVSSRASWLPPQPLAPAMTGGVRAGAPAAVPGYGAGPWSDLNAGRRLPPEKAAGTGSGQAAAGGGLLPSSRPLGRTGAIILPTVPGRTAPTNPPGPGARPTRPPLVPRPRITAEEIGGYRP